MSNTKLSKENYNKIIPSGLYKYKYPTANIDTMHISPYDNAYLYHCRNWTFRPYMYDDGITMIDTYWSSGENYIQLTDDNFDNFVLIFDFNDVIKASYRDYDLYDSKDLYTNIPVDSGGLQYSKCFIRKDAKPSKEVYERYLKGKIESLTNDLESKKQELESLNQGTHYLFKEE